MSTLYLGDSAWMLNLVPSESVNLVVTSPPYDNLREYKGYSFNFEAIADHLVRVLAPGGVIVWVVADATVNGSETGTSFRQALHFKQLGLNLHDTMIWEKTGRLPTQDRYYNVFEYMFIFSKGKPQSMNFLCDSPTTSPGRLQRKDRVINKGNNIPGEGSFIRNAFARRANIWKIHNGTNKTAHPAVFPLQLATDHVLSWSNPGDTVLDPFLGSGTTGVAAANTGRSFIGIETSHDYFKIAQQRIEDAELQWAIKEAERLQA